MEYAPRLILISAVLLLAILSINAYAMISGYESVNFTNYSARVPAGSKIAEGYTLNLVNGSYTFATTISVGNSGQLAADGIVTILDNNSGNPPFHGTLFIAPTAQAKTGQYFISLTGSGTNVSVIPGTILVYVLPYGTVTTTIPPPNTTSFSTTSSTTVNSSVYTTTATTTVSQSQQGLKINPIYIIVAIIAIVIIVIVFFLTRGRGGTIPTAATAGSGGSNAAAAPPASTN